METRTVQTAGEVLAEQTIVPSWMRDAVERAGGFDATVEVTRMVTPWATYVTAIEPVQADSFDAYEVAYRIPGQSWKRRTIKTRAAEDRFFSMIDDEAADVRWSDEHESRIASDCASD